MSENESLRVGDHVNWKWGKGEGHGTVTEVHHHPIDRDIKVSTITRKVINIYLFLQEKML